MSRKFSLSTVAVRRLGNQSGWENILTYAILFEICKVIFNAWKESFTAFEQT